MHFLRYRAFYFIGIFLCIIFVVLSLLKFKCYLTFCYQLQLAVHGIQMTTFYNRDLYIDQGGPAVFSYESRTNPLPFKPYDNNFGFSEPFPCRFLLCSAGGLLSRSLELKEVSLGLFPLTFLLFPAVTCDFFIHSSYYIALLIISIFICFNTLGTRYYLKVSSL